MIMNFCPVYISYCGDEFKGYTPGEGCGQIISPGTPRKEVKGAFTLLANNTVCSGQDHRASNNFVNPLNHTQLFKIFIPEDAPGDKIQFRIWKDYTASQDKAFTGDPNFRSQDCISLKSYSSKEYYIVSPTGALNPFHICFLPVSADECEYTPYM